MLTVIRWDERSWGKGAEREITANAAEGVLMTVSGILETVLYAEDLDAAERFYSQVVGLERVSRAGNRHVFFRCANQMLLIFNPNETIMPPAPDALPVPPHGASGTGHICFRANAEEIEYWRAQLELSGVAIESDFEWPQGGRSIYFRDPAGNSVEFADPSIWGLD